MNLSKKNNPVNSESYQTDQKIPENKNSQVAPEGEVRASDAVKISTAFKNMAEKIKVPVRYGKIKGTSNVLGQYYPDKEMIRVRYANDIETLSHEVGHHLEKIMFGDIGHGLILLAITGYLFALARFIVSKSSISSSFICSLSEYDNFRQYGLLLKSSPFRKRPY